MTRHVNALVVVAAIPGVAGAGPAERWVGRCEASLRDARLAYQATIIKDDFPRWDFGQWDRDVDKRAIRPHYYWRAIDYQLAVTATTQPGWLVHGKKDGDVWWLERVAGGRVAAVRASGAGTVRDRDTFRRIFEPALDACLETE